MSARRVAEPLHAGDDGSGRKAGDSPRAARTNEAGAETRRKLLDVAERLFATRGLDAVSLRDITETAGANMAAVHYHFGSKQDLIAALVERRSGAIGKRRSSLLDELEKSPTLDLRSVVRAIVLPTAEMVAEEGGGEYYVAFLATLGDHPEVTPTLVERVWRLHKATPPVVGQGHSRAPRRCPTLTMEHCRGPGKPPSGLSNRSGTTLVGPTTSRC